MVAHRKRYFENSAASIEEKMAYMATAVSYHQGIRPSEGEQRALENKRKWGVSMKITCTPLKIPVPDSRQFLHHRF